MTETRATALDIAVVLVTGLSALWSVFVLVVGVGRADLLQAAGAMAVLGACVATMVALWRRPSWLALQAAALIGCAFAAFVAGVFATLGCLTLGLLIALVFRRGEEIRLAHDRAERLADLG